MARKRTKKKKSFIKIILSGVFIFLAVLAIVVFAGYKVLISPNVKTGKKDTVIIYIPTGSTIDDVYDTLYSRDLIRHKGIFEWLAEQKKYPSLIKPGRYRIFKGMSNNQLINMLRSGNQEPVNVTFNNIRIKEELAGAVSKNIEADSASIIRHLNDNAFIRDKYHLDTSTIMTMFLPNTYEFYWNTNTEEFFDRMALEYKKFWNEERKEKASKIGLSQSEVSVLASIVQKETYREDDKPAIAGVYMNRIKVGMPLQADPTLIFAHKDFTIRRVLNKHKQIKSPYNTYKYRGLPPGPICLPTISSIDAVLNYDRHGYYYFVAKDDFSGYSAFSKTHREHINKANKYREALNRRRIYQ